MAFTDLLVTYFWWIILVVFLIGTLILSRTKHPRMLGFLFMIQTTHGIRWLEKIGNLLLLAGDAGDAHQLGAGLDEATPHIRDGGHVPVTPGARTRAIRR